MSWQLDRPNGREQPVVLVPPTLDVRAATVRAAQVLLLTPVSQGASQLAPQGEALLAHEGFQSVDTAEIVWSIDEAGDRDPQT